ncbi:MAG TPA: exosortase A [Vicinamibacterales bacterium]
MIRSRRFWALAALAASFGHLYREVLIKLVHDWATDGNYSHGFLIVPLAVYFAWQRRAALSAASARPSVLGLVVILGSLVVLAAGIFGAELFLSRLSMIGILAGIVLFAYGWRALRTLSFPLAFLLLMIPIPAIVFNQIAFPLQLLASRAGEAVLNVMQIPVLREGNVIVLANTSLEVAEACSGIRSLVSLLTLAIIYGYFVEPRIWARIVLAIAAIPVAVVANGARVAGTGIAAHYYGPEAAQGFFHEFSGWLVFVVAFACLFAIQGLIERLPYGRNRRHAVPANAGELRV